MKKMKQNWIAEGNPCKTDGILQDHEVVIEKVPKVAQAATIEPKYQVVL